MSTTELVEAIRRAGGMLTLDGDGIECQLPPGTAHLVPLLRERKPELIAALKAKGGRVAAFPHCPRCASYALYQCQTCGLMGIEESQARRVQ